MTDQPITRWHQHLKGQLPGGLDALLHDDVVFYSPIVFSPQRGKDLTKAYLGAAGQTFGGDEPDQFEGNSEGLANASGGGGGFQYVKEVTTGNQTVLEFETTMGATYVNGVDIITFDDDGLITEFKVMIRPLQAVNIVHERMKAMLEAMAGSDERGPTTT